MSWQVCHAATPAASVAGHRTLDPEPPSHVLCLPAGAAGYFDMAGPVVSPNEQLVAYGVDRDGSEVYTL